MHRFGVAALAALSFMAAVPAAAQSGNRHIAARVELHPLPSLTLSDPQFLQGDANGQAVTVSAQLRVAQGQGRLPAVVLMHGSGGVGPNIDMWVRELNQMGVSTLVIDGFTGRGLVAVSSDQALLGRLNFILDIYRSLDILARHPRVDPARIVLMGFSRGGQATLYASLARFHQMWNKSGAGFAAYIPFYPDCMTSYQGETETVAPIRAFHGTPDDYNPVAPCKNYFERLRAAGRDVALTEYPNAPHGFDNPLASPTPVVAKSSQTVRRCVISEQAKGSLINVATKEPFTYKDACVERGPQVGHDSEATEAAKLAVKSYLRELFKLD